MNGAQLILQRLREHGVETLFGYPGGAILPLYDALREQPLRHVLTRHEQAAAFAAEGYARASGRLGVVVATSGPGATNLVTGIANAAMDSTPMLVLTGQVPTELLGTRAFQEVDIVGMTQGICKHNALVTKPETLADILDEGIAIAVSGRPGPVLIDLPKDVLMAPVPTPQPLGAPAARAALPIAPIDGALEALRRARRPVLLSGGGVALGHALEPLRRLASELGLPHVTTLKGIGNADPRDPASLGMVGMFGSPAANAAVHACDLLLALGVRFDDRATGRLDTFAPHAKVLHVDIDPGELQRLRKAEVAIAGDLRDVLDAILVHLARTPRDPTSFQSWTQWCVAQRRRHGWELASDGGPRWLRVLSEHLPPSTRVACDVGNHQMWVARYMCFSDPRLHLSSGGLGAMGFGLPAAIGAQIADPEASVVLVSGDGSFMMNVQELATVARERLPIKMLLFDNRALAMVGQQQRNDYRGESHCSLDDNPDFVALARAFGIRAVAVSGTTRSEDVLPRFLAQPGPALLVVSLPAREEIWPLVPPGRANHPMRHASSSVKRRSVL